MINDFSNSKDWFYVSCCSHSICMSLSIKESFYKDVLNNNQCDELKVWEWAQEISKLIKTLEITIFLFLNAHNGSVLVHLFLLDFSTPRIKIVKERKLFQNTHVYLWQNLISSKKQFKVSANLVLIGMNASLFNKFLLSLQSSHFCYPSSCFFSFCILIFFFKLLRGIWLLSTNDKPMNRKIHLSQK